MADCKASYTDKQIEQTLKYLGKKIRTERESQGITREDLESLSGVSVDTIKRIEKGTPVSTENLIRIALILDVPISMLFPAPKRDKATVRKEIDSLLDTLMNL